jgi:subtilisin-like proprotein convertase family protein
MITNHNKRFVEAIRRRTKAWLRFFSIAVTGVDDPVSAPLAYGFGAGMPDGTNRCSLGHGPRSVTFVPTTHRCPRALKLLQGLGLSFFLWAPSALGQGTQSVSLAWIAPVPTDPLLAGYNVYSGTNSGVYTITNQLGNVTTAILSDLQSGTTYYFAVTDYNIFGMESAPSDELTCQVPASSSSPVNPAITWTVPGNLVYGSALSAIQLNATANVPGTFTYSPPASAVLPAGNGQTLTAVFIPSDTTNYNTVTNTVNLTVLPAPLTITADSKTKVYGAPLPALTASYAGFVNGDSVASLATPVSLSTSTSAASHVGSYSITPGGATAANYAITFVSGVLSVSPASLSITADNKSMAKGSTVPPLTASYSGFVNGETASSLTTPVMLATSGTSSSPVGTYPITASGAADADYLITPVNGVLTVTLANLVSLAVTPPTNTVTVGQTQQFTATGTYSDGTKADFTASAAWVSAAPAVATINTAGLATARSAGNTVISATQSSLSGSAALSVVSTQTTNTARFANPNAISIPAYGVASPYPSAIKVTGLSGTISKVTLTLSNYTHAAADDVNVLLVSPTGSKTVVMANAGGNYSVSGVNLTFDDAATSALPPSSRITSGTYRPTCYGSRPLFSNPAPIGPYVTNLNTFKGIVPNGTWSLYVIDDTRQHSGNIASGWSLAITTVTGAPASLAQPEQLAGNASLMGLEPSAPPAVRPGSALTIRSLVVLAGGQVQLQISGQAGQGYRLLSSTDLIDWQVVHTGNVPSEQFIIVDPAEATSDRRWYRIQPAAESAQR